MVRTDRCGCRRLTTSHRGRPGAPPTSWSARPFYPTESGTFDEGTLVYSKASLTPPDLHEYKRRHPSFPHESTVDPFFGEAQFESYRELGFRSGDAVAAEMKMCLTMT